MINRKPLTSHKGAATRQNTLFLWGFAHTFAHNSFRLKYAHEFNVLNKVPEALKAKN